jgi:hypothetical protein
MNATALKPIPFRIVQLVRMAPRRGWVNLAVSGVNLNALGVQEDERGKVRIVTPVRTDSRGHREPMFTLRPDLLAAIEAEVGRHWATDREMGTVVPSAPARIAARTGEWSTAR